MSQLSFGPYRFEPHTARLWNDAHEIRLTPKAAAVLRVLIERGGHPVTKQELFDAVWGRTVVTDDALVTCIQELRKAFADDARQPRYIQTRHRQGYLFIAEPTVAPAQSTDLSPRQGTPSPAIAVLPFSDMSPGRDQGYFCEGLAEELIDALTHIEGLRVAARSASFQFRGPGLDVREVGQRLAVASLLEGSLRKAGDRLRITVQLIDVATGYHQWSQRFECQLGDVFAIQDEIAQAVATTLRGGHLSRREQRAVRRLQTGTEPYEYFLRGRQHMHRWQLPDMDHGRDMFEQAIALDAQYAPAWAGLATIHAMLYEWWGARPEDLERADTASRTAMDLAPDLADAHVARGLSLSLHGHYDEAERHFESAIHINPNLFDAYYYYGRTCFARGNTQRAAELFGQAAQVRLEDFQSSVLQAQALRMLGRLGEANSANSEGVARAERILALNPDDCRTLSLGSHAVYDDGQRERALEWSRRSLQLYPDDMGALINAACLHAKAGLKEAAIDILERVFGSGRGKRDWVEHDPDYDSLRDDPRFQRLLARLK
jgi:adenylate cyclase